MNSKNPQRKTWKHLTLGGFWVLSLFFHKKSGQSKPPKGLVRSSCSSRRVWPWSNSRNCSQTRAVMRASSRLSCDFPATPKKKFCNGVELEILMPWRSDGRRSKLGQRHRQRIALPKSKPFSSRMGRSLFWHCIQSRGAVSQRPWIRRGPALVVEHFGSCPGVTPVRPLIKLFRGLSV